MEILLELIGYAVLEGVKNITKILFNPSVAECVQFKNRFFIHFSKLFLCALVC